MSCLVSPSASTVLGAQLMPTYPQEPISVMPVCLWDSDETAAGELEPLSQHQLCIPSGLSLVSSDEKVMKKVPFSS